MLDSSLHLFFNKSKCPSLETLEYSLSTLTFSDIQASSTARTSLALSLRVDISFVIFCGIFYFTSQSTDFDSAFQRSLSSPEPQAINPNLPLSLPKYPAEFAIPHPPRLPQRCMRRTRIHGKTASPHMSRFAPNARDGSGTVGRKRKVNSMRDRDARVVPAPRFNSQFRTARSLLGCFSRNLL